MSPKQRGAGGKLKRTEVVTVRLDPMLRYGVELAARKHHRTVSSFIEWALQRTLDEMVVQVHPDHKREVTMREVLTVTWDVDEPDRFVKLAMRFPELLSHDEQVLWKLIRESGFLWYGDWKARSGEGMEWIWDITEGNLKFELLREYWDTLKGIAEGTMDKSALPDWERKRAISSTDVDASS